MGGSAGQVCGPSWVPFPSQTDIWTCDLAHVPCAQLCIPQPLAPWTSGRGQPCGSDPVPAQFE